MNNLNETYIVVETDSLETKIDNTEMINPENTSTSTPDIPIKTNRLTGIVKWYNSKSGIGFITVYSDKYTGKDIFVHYLSIYVSSTLSSSEKNSIYLVQGEYVEFNLSNAKNNTHEHQATDVRGIMGGPVMCESRRIAMNVHSHRNIKTLSSESYNSDNTTNTVSNAPYIQKHVIVPDNTGFTQVRSGRNKKSRNTILELTQV